MTERIRVLRVIARLNVGGPALQACLLTTALDPARYVSRLVTGVEGAAEGNYLALHSQRLDGLVSVPALGRDIHGARDVLALVALVRLMRRVRPHIVHTHTAKAGTVGRLAALLTRVPVTVHTFHGHVFHGYFGAARTRLFVAIERWLARRTSYLLGVSETVRSELLDLGIGTPERFGLMRLGLDLDRFLGCDALRGQLRAELGITPDATMVGIVARLVPIKAHEIFLQAAASVARTIPGSHFIVVGDGERRAELEALARRLGLEARVRFLGWRTDLDRIYADLDVIVLCSRNEGSPVSLIEAMAAGRPVVATRVGGIPDLVEDGVCGRLVPDHDPELLARAVVDVVSEADRAREMGQAGRKRVYPAYSAGRLVDDIDQLYTALLKGAGP